MFGAWDNVAAEDAGNIAAAFDTPATGKLLGIGGMAAASSSTAGYEHAEVAEQPPVFNFGNWGTDVAPVADSAVPSGPVPMAPEHVDIGDIAAGVTVAVKRRRGRPSKQLADSLARLEASQPSRLAAPELAPSSGTPEGCAASVTAVHAPSGPLQCSIVATGPLPAKITISETALRQLAPPSCRGVALPHPLGFAMSQVLRASAEQPEQCEDEFVAKVVDRCASFFAPGTSHTK